MFYLAYFFPVSYTHLVLAKKGVKRKEIDLADYLDMCRQYALSQVDKQRQDFKRLGVSGDWENPYITLVPKYEAAQIRVFGAMADKGYIYHGAKPVYWSWSVSYTHLDVYKRQN